MKPTLYLTSNASGGLLKQLLDSQNIKYKLVVSLPDVAKLSRGHFFPFDDCLLLDGEEIIRDVFDGVHWIERKGLKLL